MMYMYRNRQNNDGMTTVLCGQCLICTAGEYRSNRIRWSCNEVQPSSRGHAMLQLMHQWRHPVQTTSRSATTTACHMSAQGRPESLSRRRGTDLSYGGQPIQIATRVVCFFSYFTAWARKAHRIKPRNHRISSHSRTKSVTVDSPRQQSTVSLVIGPSLTIQYIE